MGHPNPGRFGVLKGEYNGICEQPVPPRNALGNVYSP